MAPDLKDFKPSNPISGKPKINITPDMMKSFKTLTCDCGGMLFRGGIVIKKISPLVSPSGQEEMYPMEVIVCDTCGKVPNELNALGMLPEKVLAKKAPIGNMEKIGNKTTIRGDGTPHLTIVKDE